MFSKGWFVGEMQIFVQSDLELIHLHNRPEHNNFSGFKIHPVQTTQNIILMVELKLKLIPYEQLILSRLVSIYIIWIEGINCPYGMF